MCCKNKIIFCSLLLEKITCLQKARKKITGARKNPSLPWISNGLSLITIIVIIVEFIYNGSPISTEALFCLGALVLQHD